MICKEKSPCMKKKPTNHYPTLMVYKVLQLADCRRNGKGGDTF